jgi:hypothetical protein
MYLLKASDMVENKKLADYYKKLLNEWEIKAVQNS